jgi:hypothetical protein
MANSVFLLMHVHELTPEQEDIKTIGIYSTEAQAKAAEARAKLLPGFAEAPDGFHIDAYELDEDNWVEGYITYVPPLAPSTKGGRAKSKPVTTRGVAKGQKRS